MRSFRWGLMCLLLPCVAWGQQVSSKDRPSWVDGYFEDLDRSYIKTATAVGYTESEARDRAVEQIIGDRSQEAGVRVYVKVQSDGRISVSGKDELTVKARIIDEYRTYEVENGRYRVSVLAQVAKNPTFDFETVRITDEYGFSPSVFVPGMAQIRKGSKGKGIFFIGAETVFVGGIVVAECLRASYTSKIKSTHNAENKRIYIDNADVCRNVRNIAIAGAAAVYVWNVIDGIVAKGKKHIVIAENASLNVMPYFSPDAGGVALCLNF
ncbi:hypothetical protein [Barnesiella intestinihominis]|uniref:hypothetical protein n=1 Tax=Barnesiella intestinihominis TaxID=487174 RepID=UPI003F7CB0E2